jgi:hypothetical protein
MALPAAYTDTTIANYLHQVIGTAAAALGWTVAGNSYSEVINDTLLALGIEDVADATSIAALRAAARFYVWRAVADATTGMHRFSLDQQSFDMRQVHQNAVARQQQAESEAAALGVELSSVGVVTFTPLRDVHDPYAAYIPDEDRVLAGG